MITTGSSPADTVQTNVVCELSSKISLPNEMGTISGGSEIEKNNFTLKVFLSDQVTSILSFLIAPYMLSI